MRLNHVVWRTKKMPWRPCFPGGTAYSAEQMVYLLLGKYGTEHLCISQPINVSNNVSFLVDMSCLQHPDNLKCDDMGSWKHNGSPKRWFNVKKDTQGINAIEPLEKKPSDPADGIFELRRTYYKNSSDETVRKIVAKLEGLHFHYNVFNSTIPVAENLYIALFFACKTYKFTVHSSCLDFYQWVLRSTPLVLK